MMDASLTDVVILCAGRGQRLGQLTSTIPKVLIPVKGVPILGHQLRALHAAGFRRTVIVVGHLALAVQEYVQSASNFGLRISYCAQPEIGGTGDAVRRALSKVESDPFIVIYGDLFMPFMAKVLTDFIATNELKVASARVEDASEFGRILTESRTGGEYLVRIVEKDGVRSPGLANAGLYMLPRSIGTDLDRISPSIRGEFELPDALEREVRSGASFRVVPVDQWVDVGTMDRLASAERLPTG